MWSHLVPVLNGTWSDAEQKQFPVWEGSRELPGGTQLFRGCTAFRESEAVRMLSSPRFFTTEMKLAETYSLPKPGDRPGQRRYLLRVVTKRALTLAVAHMRPIVDEVYLAEGPASAYREGINLEFQRLKMTDICSYYGRIKYDGVFDNGGHDILIREPLAALTYRIDELR